MGCLRRFTSGLISIAAVVTLLYGNAQSQSCDASSRWANVSGWKGTFSEVGSGNGLVPDPKCTVTYTNNQAINGSPVLSGAFPGWFGDANTKASLNITVHSSCPDPVGPPILCTQTVMGGLNFGPDTFSLSIDDSSCTYSLEPLSPFITVIHTGCDGSVDTAQLGWGPVHGPDGSIVSGLPANNLETGGGVIPLPATGVDLKHTVPAYNPGDLVLNANWGANWNFKPVCTVDTTRFTQRRQFDTQWEDLIYDHTDDETIGTKGCALTSLSMALQFAGINQIDNSSAPGHQGEPPGPNDPGELNFFMHFHDTDYNFTKVNWDQTVRDVSGNKLKFQNFGGFKSGDAGKQVLDTALCGSDPHPVIVGVTGSDGSFPGHFVLVTGKDGDTYTIADPAGKGSTLDAYDNNFETRGAVVPSIDPPDKSIGALDVSIDNNASILIVDPNGQRTGFNTGSAQIIQNIPHSAYFIDALTNDVTRAAPTETSPSVEIFAPIGGEYKIIVTGKKTGEYHLSIRVFSEDGSSQPPILFTGNATADSTDTYQLQLSTAPGSVSTAKLVSTLPPTDNIPPTTTFSVSPQPNSAGWNNSNVVVTLASTDNPGGSGVKEITYSLSGGMTLANTSVPGTSVQIPITQEGITTVTFSATDNAGNMEASKSVTVMLDKTPPTITGSRTPLPNQFGWNNTDVSVSFTCSDSLSGLAAGSPPPNTVISTEGTDQSVTGTCADVAGNSASATVSDINIDKTPPTLTCSATPNVLWPPNNKLVNVTAAVNVADALSGSGGFQLLSVTSNEPDSGMGDILGWTSGTPSTAGQLRETRLGNGGGRVYSFSYRGFDKAGNSATCDLTVLVPHDQGH